MIENEMGEMSEDLDGLAATVEPYEGEGEYVQIDPWYYRSNGDWTYNQCSPFQTQYIGNQSRRICQAGYEPTGQAVCTNRWVRQSDGSYVEIPVAYIADRSAYQACMTNRASECSGCRPLGNIGSPNYSPYGSYGYRVCDYVGGAKAPEEVQKEYLVTQAMRYNFLSGQNCRNLSVCDANGKQASSLRSCTFRAQNGQQLSFDSAAAYAAQFFNVPTQLVPVVASY